MSDHDSRSCPHPLLSATPSLRRTLIVLAPNQYHITCIDTHQTGIDDQSSHFVYDKYLFELITRALNNGKYYYS